MTANPPHVLCMLKTSNGGMWVLPQIEALLRRGARVSVLIPPEAGRLRQELDCRGIRVIESPFDFRFVPTFKRFRGLLQIRRELRSLQPDVIFYHLYATALAARIASLGLRIPRVHMVPGPLYLDSPLIRFIERYLARLDDLIIPGSEHTMHRYAALGLPAKRMPAIPYGVDVVHYTPASTAERNQHRIDLRLPAESFVAVMVAYVYAPKRLAYGGRGIKGHDIMLNAWQKFHCRHSNARLLIVGGGFGPGGESLKQVLVASMRPSLAAYGISWFDTVDDVRPFYAAADVSVAPSLSENHGSALEAGACGVPSIVSDAGGLPETVTPYSGWVVPAGDAQALDAALESAYVSWTMGSLPECGRAARTLVSERFDAARSGDSVACLVLEAATQGGTRR